MTQFFNLEPHDFVEHFHTRENRDYSSLSTIYNIPYAKGFDIVSSMTKTMDKVRNALPSELQLPERTSFYILTFVVNQKTN